MTIQTYLRYFSDKASDKAFIDFSNITITLKFGLVSGHYPASTAPKLEHGCAVRGSSSRTLSIHNCTE